MRKIVLIGIAISVLSLTACAKAPASPVAEVQEAPVGTTRVTAENYGLAETQEIMKGYVEKIAKATGTNGTGAIMHVREGADPTD